MKKIDKRDNITVNKCRSCKYSRKVDRWNLICHHERWKDGPWGGTSYLMGNSTFACECFESK